MDNQQVTLDELGWLAGIIDGEGYLGICLETDHRHIGNYCDGKKAVAMLHITNTDEAIVLKARDIMRKVGINPYIRVSQHKGVKKDVYRLQTKRFTNIITLLPFVIPYMTGEKKKRAELVLEFCISRQSNEGIAKKELAEFSGLKGYALSGRIKPYTPREMQILEQVVSLQKRGTSETLRELRRSTSEIWRIMKERQTARES